MILVDPPDLPRHVFAIEDNLLLAIRAESDGLRSSTAFCDLDVGAGLVCTGTEINDITSGGSVNGGLDRTEWRGRCTGTSTSGRHVDFLGGSEMCKSRKRSSNAEGSHGW